MTHSTAAALLATRDSTSYDSPERWQEQAACRGVPLDAFFPPPMGPASYDQAATYCASCPVKRECLEDCKPWEVGFRGGMTPRQRDRWRGKRRPYARSTGSLRGLRNP